MCQRALVAAAHSSAHNVVRAYWCQRVQYHAVPTSTRTRLVYSVLVTYSYEYSRRADGRPYHRVPIEAYPGHIRHPSEQPPNAVHLYDTRITVRVLVHYDPYRTTVPTRTQMYQGPYECTV